MITFVAPATLARSNPTIRASYSASLLVVRKLSRIMHSILSPFGEWITTLAPCAHLLDNPSVWMLLSACAFAP